MRVHDRRGHQFRRLVAGEAEHKTLVTRTLLGGGFAGRGFGIDALRNVRTLRGQVIVDEHAVGVKHIIVVNVADPADGIAHDLFDVELGLGRNFTADADDVAFDECLAGDPAAAILREAGVKHSVGYCVGYFVGMAFANRLRRKNVVFVHKNLISVASDPFDINKSRYDDMSCFPKNQVVFFTCFTLHLAKR